MNKNGIEIINAPTILEAIKLLVTSQAAILAHSKEGNATVERCNKETMRHINAMISKSISAIIPKEHL